MLFFKRLATVSGLTLLSRVLGFFRDVIMAGVLGAGPIADAFYVAFRLPNMFRRFLAEGAFQAAFVPLFVRRLEEEGQDSAKRFAEDVMVALLVILTLLTAFAELATPLFVYALASGFAGDPYKFDLAVHFTRIMFPYLACMSLVGLMGGVLNSVGKFFAAAAAPVLLNIVLITAAIFFVDGGDTPGHVMSWAVFAAGLAQFGALYIGCRAAGYDLRLRWPRLTPGVRRLAALGLPGFIAAGATQINLIIGNNIASWQDGAVSWLRYADAFYQLPLGMIGIAISIVLLPDLAKRVRGGDDAGAIHTLNRSCEASMLLTLPATAAFLVMPTFITDTAYRDLPTFLLGESAFTVLDSARTGAALFAFALGLPAFVLIKVFSPGYFAREDTKTPMYFALFSIAINAAVSLALFQFIGYLGVAVATSIAGWVNAGMLAARLYRRGEFVPDAQLVSRLPRIVLASAAMGAGVWFCVSHASGFTSVFWGLQWAALLAIVVLGAIGYLGCAFVFGAARLRDLRALTGKRSSNEGEMA